MRPVREDRAHGGVTACPDVLSPHTSTRGNSGKKVFPYFFESPSFIRIFAVESIHLKD